MGLEDYAKARKMAGRQYRSAVSTGLYPYLPALDEMLSYAAVAGENQLGLVEIPLNMIAGTKTAGRQNAFSNNFLPLLGEKTEFAQKWMALYDAQLEEGIRDPIIAYEFMNKFYVQEGNKRVSVLKFVGAASISAYVTRIVPKRTEEKANKIYYEFMEYYRIAGLNEILFSKEGSYKKLLKLSGFSTEEPWSKEERAGVHGAYTRFKDIYLSKGGGKLPITTGDAFLVYLGVFDINSLLEKTGTELREIIGRMWEEFQLAVVENAVVLQERPEEKETSLSSNLLDFLIPASNFKHKIAFINEKTPETSSWTYGHELGRLHLQQVLGDKVETAAINGVIPEENGLETIELAIAGGYDVIFTTTPRLVDASMKAAVKYPDVKILNCSVNTSYKRLRTYYGRMHEAKFLMGAIAAAMSESDNLGYVADYPINGMIASINAFALGAQMVNPRAKVFLDWSTLKERNTDYIEKNHITCISGQDMIKPSEASREFGLYRLENGEISNIATPIWNWGRYYERIVRSIMDGGWDNEAAAKGYQALNYWWGMSADVIEIICSNNMPAGVKRLVDVLKEGICQGTFQPFAGELRAQDRVIQEKRNQCLLPEQIVKMDWLAENVVGVIPKFSELSENAQAVVRLQGVKNETDGEEE